MILEYELPRGRNGVGDAGEGSPLLGWRATLALQSDGGACKAMEVIEVEARPDIEGVLRE